MSVAAALQPVAELLGIATRHVDALGVVHEPSTATLERFVAPVELPPQPERALAPIVETSRPQPFVLAPLELVAPDSPTRRLHLPPIIPVS